MPSLSVHRRSTSGARLTRLACVVLTLCAPAAGAQGALAAQVGGGRAANPQSSYATRAELERGVRLADSIVLAPGVDAAERGRRQRESERLKQRLHDGDFLTGDRLVVHISEPALHDTLIVRAGQLLQLPDLGEIPLAGVLRAEVQTYLTEQLRRYLRDPRVQAQPLLRLAVVGRVAHPGFFSVPPDLPLSEVLMRAGGPSPDADLARISVRRSGRVIVTEADGRIVIPEGWTVDRLSLRAGDEIVVGQRRQFNWQTAAQVMGIASSVGFLVLSLSRR